MANTMRLCAKCRKWTAVDTKFCATCNVPLIVTSYTDIFWKKASDKDKENLTEELLKKNQQQVENQENDEALEEEFEYSSEGKSYVVLQVVLKEELIGTGSKNLKELERVINRQADKGYRLHTISTANGGSKGLLGGDRIQATMVFEKIGYGK